ncbi:hypothetical protein KYTH83_02230 [Helicobacter pylori]
MGLKGVLFQNPLSALKNTTKQKLTIKKLKNKFFKKNIDYSHLIKTKPFKKGVL